MTDEQVLKAIECCTQADQNSCDDCLFYDKENGCCDTDFTLLKRALDLIKKKDAEIERLTKENKKLKHEMSYMSNPYTIGDRHEMGG